MISALCLKLWPSLRNPAWTRSAAASAVLGTALAVTVKPRRVRRKLDSAAMGPLKGQFLVDGLAGLPARDITALYTHDDMADVAGHGEDVAATRLYRWLVASYEAGRPVKARGQVIDNAEKAAACCRSNLDLYRSLQRNGYNYTGPDEICLGIAADGEIIHMRRGTHRMAAAHLLDLPSITAQISHVDRAFAARAVRSGGTAKGTVAALAQAIQEVTRQTLA